MHNLKLTFAKCMLAVHCHCHFCTACCPQAPAVFLVAGTADVTETTGADILISNEVFRISDYPVVVPDEGSHMFGSRSLMRLLKRASDTFLGLIGYLCVTGAYSF